MKLKRKVCVAVCVLLCFILYLRPISKYKLPGAYIQMADLTAGFCVTSLGGLHLEGLTHAGIHFRNFTLIYHFATLRGKQC